MSKEEEILKVSQIAKLCNRSKQTIYCAVRQGRMQAQKTSRGWMVTKSQFDYWIKNRYSRRYFKYEGKEIYDFDKGVISILEASRIYSKIANKFRSVQIIYYAIRIGRLKASRMGSHWVIQKENLLEWIKANMIKNHIDDSSPLKIEESRFFYSK